jgi:hypothetical protein
MFVLLGHNRSQVAAGDSHRNMAVGYFNSKHIVEWKGVVQIFVDVHLNSLFIDVPILKHRSTTHISHSS